MIYIVCLLTHHVLGDLGWISNFGRGHPRLGKVDPLAQASIRQKQTRLEREKSKLINTTYRRDSTKGGILDKIAVFGPKAFVPNFLEKEAIEASDETGSD
jgi:hypothetical protein